MTTDVSAFVFTVSLARDRDVGGHRSAAAHTWVMDLAMYVYIYSQCTDRTGGVPSHVANITSCPPHWIGAAKQRGYIQIAFL